MFSHSMRLVVTLVRLITGLAAVAIGLGAMGVNVQGMLHLESVDMLVRVVIGLCGAYSLVSFLMSFGGCCDAQSSCKK